MLVCECVYVGCTYPNAIGFGFISKLYAQIFLLCFIVIAALQLFALLRGEILDCSPSIADLLYFRTDRIRVLVVVAYDLSA